MSDIVDPFKAPPATSDGGIVDPFASPTISRPTQAAPAPAETSGDFMRGLKRVVPELKQLAGGTLAAAGDVAGLDKVRDYGLGIYKAQEAKIAPLQKPTDSFTEAKKRVMAGDLGAGVDFLQNAAGYTLGQAGESLAAAGIGALAGSEVPGFGNAAGAIGGFLGKAAVKGAVKQQAEKLIAKQVAEGASREVAEAAGKKLIADSAGKKAAEVLGEKAVKRIGGAALGAQAMNTTMELGSVYPTALEGAQAEGRDLTTGEKAKAVGASLAAAGLESAADLFNLGVLFRGTKNIGEAAAKTGLKQAAKDYAGRAAIAGTEGALREAGTEGAQTFLERVGATQSLNDADAWRDYIDSAAVGAVGGVLFGGAAAFHKQDKAPEFGKDPADAARADVIDAQASGDPVVADVAVQNLHDVLAEQGRVQPQDFQPPEQGYNPAPIGFQPPQFPKGTLSRVAQRATEMGVVPQPGSLVSAADPESNSTPAEPAPALASDQNMLASGVPKRTEGGFQIPPPPGVNPATGEYTPPTDDALKAAIHAAMDQQFASQGKVTRSGINRMVPGVVPKRMAALFDQVKAERKQGVTAAHYAENPDGQQSLADAQASGVDGSGDLFAAGSGADQSGPQVSENAGQPAAAQVDTGDRNDTGRAAEPPVPGDVAGDQTQGLSYDTSTELQESDLVPPSGEPYTHERAANLQAGRIEGGKVFPVDGGFVVRVPQAARAANSDQRADAQAGPSSPQLESPSKQEAEPSAAAETQPSTGDRNTAPASVAEDQPSVTPSEAAGTVPAPVQPSPAGSAQETAQSAQHAQSAPPAVPATAQEPPQSSVGAATSVQKSPRETSGPTTAVAPVTGGQTAAGPVSVPSPEGSPAAGGVQAPGQAALRASVEAQGKNASDWDTAKLLRSKVQGSSVPVNKVPWTKLAGGKWSDGNRVLSSEDLARVFDRFDDVIDGQGQSVGQGVIEGQSRRIEKQKALPAPASTASRPAATAPAPESVQAAAAQAATSPTNSLPVPTEAQKEAGNFTVGRLKVNGLDISIEHPAGVKRKPGHTQALAHAYGYVRRTEGADGEKVDVFLGEHATDTTRPVFVVNQHRKDGSFDEHKAMMGFATEQEARKAYKANFPKGWKGLGAIKRMSQDEFKAWVQNPAQTKKPLAAPAQPKAETRKSPKEYLAEVKAAQQAGKDAPRETITPAEDTRLGDNIDGHPLYERKDGSRYIIRNGRPEFGAALLTEAEAQADREQNPNKAETPSKATAANKVSDQPTSWVLREKATGKVIAETRDPKKVAALNTEKYEAVPVKQHLAELNQPESLAAKAARQESSPAPKEAGKAAPEAIDAGTLDGQLNVMKRRDDGTLSLDEYRAGFAALQENRERILADLGKLTKEKLVRIGGMGARLSDPKDRLVRGAYSDLVTDYNLSGSFTWNMGERVEDVIAAKVAAATEQDLRDYADRVAKSRAERKANQESAAAGLQDPKTIEDFARVARSLGGEASLTPAQRAKFDALRADARREDRDAAAKRNAIVRQVDTGNTGMELVETKHTQKGHDLFVVKMAERVDGEIYKALNVAAKRLGGHYSSFRGNGAVPGFTFTTREAAQQFMAVREGNVDASGAQQARAEAKAENRAESLADKAAALREKGEASLNRDRKANTVKRAGQAQHAEAEARKQIALADTMAALSKAIESGKAKMLAFVRHKSQVELLDKTLRAAHWEHLRAQGVNWEEAKEAPLSADDITNAMLPRFYLSRGDAIVVARRLVQARGGKAMGQALAKEVDYGDEYGKAVQDNPHKFVVAKRNQAGESSMAFFARKRDAEAALAASGDKVRGVVVKMPRAGKTSDPSQDWAVALSPDLAIERKLWQPDYDKKVHLSPTAAEKILDVLKIDQRGDSVVPYWWASHLEERKQFAKLGIETNYELREALREYLALRQKPAEEDRIRKLERSLVGQNVGNDFFPTPPAVVQRLIEQADIGPGMRVLEPSAGKGDIAEAVRDAADDVTVDTVEMSHTLRELLEAKGFDPVGQDFLDFKPESQYDRIVMNPPFGTDNGASHVRHAYSMLKPGGRLVAVMGAGTRGKAEFDTWLDKVGGMSEALPEGSFKSSFRPTGVSTVVVQIDKDDRPLENTEELTDADLTPAERAAFARQIDQRDERSAMRELAAQQSREEGEADADRRGWRKAVMRALGPTGLRVEFMRNRDGLDDGSRSDIDNRNTDRSVQTTALYEPTTGRVVIFTGSKNRPVDRVVWDAFHEIAGHDGLRKLLGANLDKALTLAGENPTVAKVAAAIANERNLAPTQKLLAIEEALAELAAAVRTNDFAQIESRYGVNVPTGIREKVKAVIDEFLRRLKNLLNRQTGREAFTDADVRALLEHAWQAAQGNEQTAGDTMQNMELTGQFYSALLQAVNEGKGAPKKADATAWGQWLDGAVRRGEVKQSERNWLGIDDFLTKNGTTTREQLADFVRANQVQVQDVVLGSESAAEQARLEKELLRRGYETDQSDEGDGLVYDADGELVNEGGVIADSVPAADRELIERLMAPGNLAPKFASYQLPGGENYRELLLTLPTAPNSGDNLIVEPTPGNPARWRIVDTNEDAELDVFDSQAEALQARAAMLSNPAGEPPSTRAGAAGAGVFLSSHFDQPNILAHLRINDRTDADGNKVLFVEEIQSDWHQAGRKKGYSKGTTGWTAELLNPGQGFNSWQINDGAGNPVAKIVGGSAEAAIAKAAESQGVPDAPFKATDEWAMLAFKRAVVEAVQQGKDAVAWTTGAQQAERYDLSKQVDQVTAYKLAGGGFKLSVIKKDAHSAEPAITVKDEAELEATIGKDLAKQIVADKGDVNTYRGLDLKVGGEGMRAFYDKILPSAVNKWAKRFGGRVADAAITGPAPKGYITERNTTTIDGERKSHVVYADGGIELGAYRTYAEARARLEQKNELTVHSLTITPAMKEAALSGLPLFSTERQDITDTPAFRKWFGDSKVVDADGKPLVVYHGTAEPISEFKAGPTQRHGHGKQMPGVYFSPLRSTAAAYARTAVNAKDASQDGPGHVAAAYLSIQNPAGFTGVDEFAQADRAKLEAAGHDGALRRNDFGEVVEIVAFRPEQIKSATANNGNFDASKPSILENVEPIVQRASPDVIADIEAVMNAGGDKTLLQQAKDKLASLVPGKVKDALRPTWLAGLTTDMLAELGSDYHANMTLYADFLKAMNADRNELQQDGEDLAEAVRQWGSKHPQEAKALFKLMHQATIDGVDPAKEYAPLQFRFSGHLHEVNPKNIREARKAIQQQIRERAGDSKKDMLDELKKLKAMLAAEPRRKAQYPALVQKWAALSPEAKAHYEAMRDKYAERSEMVEEGLIARIEDTDAPDNHKRKLINVIRQQFETQRLQGVYFPLQRFGQYFVSATKGDTDTFLMFESLNKLEAGVKLLKDKGFRINAQGLKSQGKAVDAPSGTFVAEVIAKLKAAHISEATQDDIYQMYLQALPEMSMRKHAIHRQAVPGFDPDAVRGFAFNMLHGAHQIARLRYAHKLADTITLLKGQQESRRKEPDADTRRIAAGDAILNELALRHQWIMNPTDSKATGLISSAGFVYYLGLTPAAALVNLSQTALLTFPYLAARHGPVKAMNHLLNGMRDSIRTGGHIQKVLTDPDELRMHAELQRRGTLDKTQAYNLGGIAEGGLSGHNPQWAKAMSIIGLPFHKAEVVNREASSIAAYRLARLDGKSHEEAVDAAARAVNDTHFDYTNQNRARVFQSGTAKTLLMFRQYSLNMTWHLGRMLWQATKNADPEVKKIARRNMAGVLGMSALFSGTLGLPMMSVTFGVLNAIAASLGDDDEPWDAETEFRAFLNDMFGKGAGEVIANGGVNAITGADVASRVSLSQLWFRDADRELDGRGAYYNLLEQAAGPMGGVLKNALVGKQMIDEGHVMRGIETMLPKALKDTIKAQRYATEGVNNLRGDPLVADVSLRDTLLQLSGFTPDKVASQYDVNRSLKNYEQAILDRRGYLLDAFAMALRTEDDDTRREVLAKIQHFNQTNPEIAITTRGIRQSLAARARYSQDAENGITLNRKLAAKVHAAVEGEG